MDTNTNNLPLNVEGFIRSLCDVMLRAAAPQPAPQPAPQQTEIDYSEMVQHLCYATLAENISTDGMTKEVLDNLDHDEIASNAAEQAAEMVGEDINHDDVVSAAAETLAQNIDEDDIVRAAADCVVNNIDEDDVTQAAAEMCAERVDVAKLALKVDVEAVAKHVLAGLDYQKLAMAMVAALQAKEAV